ncbi:hypothetical protein F2P56_012736 [Juglans regia]|uniref:Response regulatory domain-containing protein n=1 Tax=Juglans regia TaxID=51240 RepID=A0A833XKD5_JUGRE|nr:hypothetical protein F2P56_012736 [Juglans regia]
MELHRDFADTQQKQKQHFHVLAVDDSLIERKLLERLLAESSCKVTCVDSGDKALEYLSLLDSQEIEYSADLSSSPPSAQEEAGYMKVNLIMTDYSMPGMSGYDLLKRVKRVLYWVVTDAGIFVERHTSSGHVVRECALQNKHVHGRGGRGIPSEASSVIRPEEASASPFEISGSSY